MLSLQRILVATDFSDASARALAYGVELSERLGATITVVHVFGTPIYGLLDGVLVTTSNYGEELALVAQRGLDAAVAPYRARKIALDAVLRRGEAPVEIQALAEERHADLIVMGTHGRKGVAHALLGSVAEKVIRTANVPVLTIRASSG